MLYERIEAYLKQNRFGVFFYVHILFEKLFIFISFEIMFLE